MLRSLGAGPGAPPSPHFSPLATVIPIDPWTCYIAIIFGQVEGSASPRVFCVTKRQYYLQDILGVKRRW